MQYQTIDTEEEVTIASLKDPLIGRRYDEIEEESLEWLWPNRLAIGNYHLISGQGGTSKSYLTCMLAAQVSTGRVWPDGGHNSEVGGSNVLILNHEDNPSVSLKKRLRDAGADLSKIVHVEYGHDGTVQLTSSGKSKFKLPEHLGSLENAIEYYNARLVILDPFSRCLNAEISITSPKVQAIIESLVDISARHGCCIVVVNHLKPGYYRPENITSRILGHESLNSLARISYLVYTDPKAPGISLMKQIKNNLTAQDEIGLAYRKNTNSIGRTFIEIINGFNISDSEALQSMEMSKNRKKVLLALQNGEEMRPHELANKCQCHYSTMRSLLRRMVTDCEIINTSYGFYCLPGKQEPEILPEQKEECQVSQPLQVLQVLHATEEESQAS